MAVILSLYDNLCSYDNLFLAYNKARKHKTRKYYVIEFERNLSENLHSLRTDFDGEISAKEINRYIRNKKKLDAMP